MSGTAWFTANLFAISAVYLRSRDRRWPSFAIAVLAAISYGTGIVAWPAVIATGASRRPVRQWWREWPYAVGFAVTFVWYRLSDPGNSYPSDPVEIVRGAAGMLGFVFGFSGVAGELVGCVALIGVPTLVVGLWLSSRQAAVAGWIGVATFGWLATLELAYGRVTTTGAQNRYSSLAAYTWLGLAALTMYTLRGVGERLAGRRVNGSKTVLTSPWMSIVVVVPLFLGAVVAGRPHATRCTT